ncbi:hypothetical protein IEO21_03082 [Rhodonia placenta]|nr:hypothetical protein IEO21_03082 [Postia placenta]
MLTGVASEWSALRSEGMSLGSIFPRFCVAAAQERRYGCQWACLRRISDRTALRPQPLPSWQAHHHRQNPHRLATPRFSFLSASLSHRQEASTRLGVFCPTSRSACVTTVSSCM